MPRDHVIVAAWFALTLGLSETVILLYRRLFLNEFIWSSRDLVWMAPLAYLMAFGLPACGLALWARAERARWRLSRYRVPVPWTFGVLAGTATLLLLRLLTLRRLHIAALLVLALGVAIQAARLLARRPGLITLFRRAIPGVATLVLLAGLGSRWFLWNAEQRARRTLPAAPTSDRNILFLILDTVGAGHLSLYGYHRPTTPRLERWAPRAVVFDRAIAPSSWTLQSHASFFTGRYAGETRVGFTTPLDNTYSTIAGVLTANGYQTGGFAANQAYVSYESGLSRGFIHYEAYRVTFKQILLSTELGQLLSAWNSQLILRTRDAKPVTIVNQEFLKWLDGIRTDRPFFAFLNYMEAHVPYTAPDSIRARFGADTSDRLVDAYDAAVAYLDQEIGGLLDTLAARGVLDRTLVVISADHGELFGEHGLWDHGNSLYYPAVHVPLLVLDPAIATGLRVADAVSLRELPATFITYAGVQGTPVFPSQPLSRYWDSAGARGTRPFILTELAQRPRVPSRFPNAHGSMYALFQAPYHYIRSSRGVEELYDFLRDPTELHDLAHGSEGPALLESFRALARSMGVRR